MQFLVSKIAIVTSRNPILISRISILTSENVIVDFKNTDYTLYDCVCDE